MVQLVYTVEKVVYRTNLAKRTMKTLHRRKFLQATLLSSATLLLNKKAIAATAVNLRTTNQHPIVISTWDFGKAANAEAWKVLHSNGNVLDAVENGVKVPEADPENHSVGLGGLPDREG